MKLTETDWKADPALAEARAAVGVAVDKWHRAQGGLYEGQFLATREANKGVTEALDKYRDTVAHVYLNAILEGRAAKS